MAHAPEWPDKIMAAAALTTLGGLLSVFHGALLAAGASFNTQGTWFALFLPIPWLIGIGLLTTIIGIFAYIHQAWVLTTLAILLNIVSFGLLGTSTLIGIIAIWPLIRSFAEGEEIRLDRHRMRAHTWPDKAIMGGVVLGTAGIATLVQGLLIGLDMLAAPVVASTPDIWAAVSILAGLGALLAAREAFHVRNSWAGWLGAIACFVAGAFWVIGPVLAVAAAAYLALASREAEFLLTPTD